MRPLQLGESKILQYSWWEFGGICVGRLFAADLQLSSPLIALLCKNLLLGSPRHLLRSPRAATAAAAAASSYYCRRLITRRLRRRGMALSAGDVPTMYAVLVNSLSADEAARRPAEAALAQCETRPGFCSCLLVTPFHLPSASHPRFL